MPWQQYDCLFLLDFAARYAVDRCQKPDDLDIAVLSLAAILPLIVWICGQILLLLQAEIYLMMARFTLTLLTIIQVGCLYIFRKSPPVVGCGPAQSFPSSQMSLCAYLMVTIVCYGRDFRPNSRKTRFCLVLVFVWVSYGVLTIGFADAASCIAGALLGSVVASTFHELVLFLVYDQPRLFGRLVWYVECISGTVATEMIGCASQRGTVATEMIGCASQRMPESGTSRSAHDGDINVERYNQTQGEYLVDEICMGFRAGA